MCLILSDKQTIAFESPATELLYGGAAGGGKSYFVRALAVYYALEIPGIQIYLFRRSLPELRANYLRGPTSLFVALRAHIASGFCTWRSRENEFTFENDSRISLNYCQHEDDVYRLQGAEIHILLIDELTHFTEYVYRFLRSRVRLVGMKLPRAHKGGLPRIVCCSNPGGVGHAWVKRTFVNGIKPGGGVAGPLEVWRTSTEDGAMLRQYIPARFQDNPFAVNEDPAYLDRLSGLGAPGLVRAMREGDWDIVAGQALEKLRRAVHGIEPFAIPRHWTRFRALDWGSSKPFAVLWFAVSDGCDLPDGRAYPRGALIVYREWYGWNGHPNQGARMETAEVARGVVRRSSDEECAYSVADPSMWKVDGGPSHAEQFLRYGVPLRRAANARKIGYLELRNRLAGDEDPMLYLFTDLQHTWRTLPDLVLDEVDGEDVDTEQEDHLYDALRYGCMSRPYVRASDHDKSPVWPGGQTIDEIVRAATLRRLECD